MDLDERSPQLGIKYRDLLLMNEIAKRATDLSQPRHVLFYLYAPARDIAEAMAAEARSRGFEAEVPEPSPEGSQTWPLVCQAHAVLAADFVRDSVDFFEALAERHRGEYDGWEAAV